MEGHSNVELASPGQPVKVDWTVSKNTNLTLI